MIPLEEIGRTRTADGVDLALYHRDGAFQIRLDGLELMSSYAHGSEDALSRLAVEALPRGVAAPRVLVGGLGMGFTLRAALRQLPAVARVVVAEVFAAVIEWNRGPLAHLADAPLDDPRVEVRNGDVGRQLAPDAWDVILLDVDNGPHGFTLASNDRLYGPAGVARLYRALRPGGVLTVWSASREDWFVRRLRGAGFDARSRNVGARGEGVKGPRHTIFVARRR